MEQDKRPISLERNTPPIALPPDATSALQYHIVNKIQNIIISFSSFVSIWLSTYYKRVFLD